MPIYEEVQPDNFDGLEPDDWAQAWTGLRLSTGQSHEDIYETCGFPLPMQELWEDYGGMPELDDLDVLALQVYDCQPGELYDAARFIAEAHTHDVGGEREDRRQATILLRMLERQGSVTYEQMKDAGVSIYNAPYNVLYDDGHPVEIVRQGNSPVGVRLKAEA